MKWFSGHQKSLFRFWLLISFEALFIARRKFRNFMGTSFKSQKAIYLTTIHLTQNLEKCSPQRFLWKSPQNLVTFVVGTDIPFECLKGPSALFGHTFEQSYLGS